MIDEKLVEKLANLPSLGYINRDGRNCHCSDCVAYRKAVIRDVIVGRGLIEPQPSPEPTKKFPLRHLVAVDEENNLYLWIKDSNYPDIVNSGWSTNTKRLCETCAVLGLSREEVLALLYKNTGAKLVGDNKWEIEPPEPPEPPKTYAITELEAVLKGHPELVAWDGENRYAAHADCSDSLSWIGRDGNLIVVQSACWDDLSARYTIMSLEDWKAGKKGGKEMNYLDEKEVPVELLHRKVLNVVDPDSDYVDDLLPFYAVDGSYVGLHRNFEEYFYIEQSFPQLRKKLTDEQWTLYIALILHREDEDDTHILLAEGDVRDFCNAPPEQHARATMQALESK